MGPPGAALLAAAACEAGSQRTSPRRLPCQPCSGTGQLASRVDVMADSSKHMGGLTAAQQLHDVEGI